MTQGFRYNIKRFDYENGTQYRLYRNIMTYGTEREVEEKNENNNGNKKHVYDRENEEICEENIDERVNEDNTKSLKESRNRTVQKIYGIARANKWDLFLTITFNPKKVNSADYDEVVRKTSKWINNLKARTCPDMKYLLVPEQHESGCWHFHGLLADCPELTLIDSGITHGGHKIYNLDNWKYGFTTVMKVYDLMGVPSYIAKYISKDVCEMTFGKKKYWASKNCIRPEQIMSIDLVEDIDEFMVQLMPECKHIKTLSTHGQIVHYLEV